MDEILLSAQKTFLFPEVAISRILNGKDIDVKIEKHTIKSKILTMLDKKQMYISDISDALGIEPKLVIDALKELKKEKRVNVVD